MTDPFREYDAAYVLGALSPTERKEFEAHLEDCLLCAESVRELAGLPGLLAAVPQEVAELRDAGPVPDTLLPSLVREVRRHERRRRWTTAGAAGVAAAAVAVAALGFGGVLDGGPAPRPPATAAASGPHAAPSASGAAMAPLASSPLHAHLLLAPVAWGTRLDLTCTYDRPGSEAYPDGPAYVLVVRSRDGRTQQVASWRAVPGRTMSVTGASSWTRGQIEAVEVRTTDGTPLLQLRS